jgi:hypothetical protein
VFKPSVAGVYGLYYRYLIVFIVEKQEAAGRQGFVGGKAKYFLYSYILLLE